MYLKRIDIEHIRIVQKVAIDPSPGLNLLVGANGSGKSSLLEGLYMLSTGRSFRSRQVNDVVTRGQRVLRVVADVVGEGGGLDTLGVERAANGHRIRISGQDVRNASRLARLLPTVLVTPESQRLLSDGAVLRRRLIDWALFHVEHSYADLHQRYRRALRQRNAELRAGIRTRCMGSWDVELARLGERLHECRARHLSQVLAAIADVAQELIGMTVEVEYEAGWDVNAGLLTMLERSREADCARGYTAAGPHRADLSFRVNRKPAHLVLSRGEGKLFVVGVLLAQLSYLSNQLGRIPVLLVDDLASELDASSRERFLEAARGTGAQMFVTAVAADSVPTSGWDTRRMFHVEQGRLLEMV